MDAQNDIVDFDLDTKIDPWDDALLKVMEQLDEDDIKDITLLLRNEVDVDEEKFLEFLDFQKLLIALEEKHDNSTISLWLEKALDRLNLHEVTTGTKLSDIIMEYRTRLNNHLQSMDVLRNETFLGRTDDLKSVKEGLENVQMKGVYICGMGGMGKTSLARQVCSLLVSDWKIVNINLRDKFDLASVLCEIVSKNGEVVGQSPEKQVLELLESIKDDTIWFLDDADAILQDKESNKEMLNFLERVMCKMEEINEQSKVKLLLTTRQKLSKKDLNLKEVELGPMSEADAMDLLKQNMETMHIEEKDCRDIVNGCGCSPLAITVIASKIERENINPRHIVLQLRLDEKDVTETLRVKKCLQQTICTLQSDLQEMLVCMSVFQTSPISFHDACSILYSKRQKSRKTSKDTHQRQPEDKLKELNRYHLIEIDTEEKRINVSLHPLVYKYLLEWNPQTFKVSLDEAYKSFAVKMESIINKIGKYLSMDCFKGLRKIEEYKTHITKYYYHMYKDSRILPSYKVERVSSKDVLQKFRIRELTDILFSNDRKRASFQSEARRAQSENNMVMFLFWMVEVADVYVAQDRPEFALDCLKTLEDKYPYFRNFETQVMYTRLVHVLFHMVKGQSLARLEIPRLEDSYKHLDLAKSFCNGFQPREDYRHLFSKITKEIGDLCYKKKDLDGAEEYYMEAERMLLQPTYLDNPQLPSQDDNGKPIDYHLDKPIFLNCRALINFQKGLIASTGEERKRLFDLAVTTYSEGMSLDIELKLDQRDGFAQKLKNRADVYIQMGLLTEALRDAEEAMDMRREILRPPHSFMTQSVFQVAKLYDLIGDTKLREEGHEYAMRYWLTSKCYFDELVKHHFKMGSISKQNILYPDIKEEHLKLLRKRNDMKELKTTEKFYKDFENGKYDKEADRGRHILVNQTMPPSEFLEECFKKGLTFMQAPEPMEGVEGQDPGDLGLGPERRHSSDGSEEENFETTDVTDSTLQGFLQQFASPLVQQSSQPPQVSSENIMKQPRKKKKN
ncbi:hypothetical protein CHS0354_000310 [Potamilus streckersoni]|uniref:AAA+ ATPase domain-containing protein n=1 Tax=Potamilus streckersoni TaxID=2493646 RepID=A0AAE0SB19_9BIVA|nr:hypothetical protein CHS0354_000310 [Potamilus streckersoni]